MCYSDLYILYLHLSPFVCDVDGIWKQWLLAQLRRDPLPCILHASWGSSHRSARRHFAIRLRIVTRSLKSEHVSRPIAWQSPVHQQLEVTTYFLRAFPRCSSSPFVRWIIYGDGCLHCFAYTQTRERAHVCTLGTGCCACPLRRLRDFPLRVRVHNDVSGLRERNFGKSRRWRYQKHRQLTGRRASQKISHEIFVVTLLYVTDIRWNTDTISMFFSTRRKAQTYRMHIVF